MEFLKIAKVEIVSNPLTLSEAVAYADQLIGISEAESAAAQTDIPRTFYNAQKMAYEDMKEILARVQNREPELMAEIERLKAENDSLRLRVVEGTIKACFEPSSVVVAWPDSMLEMHIPTESEAPEICLEMMGQFMDELDADEASTKEETKE